MKKVIQKETKIILCIIILTLVFASSIAGCGVEDETVSEIVTENIGSENTDSVSEVDNSDYSEPSDFTPPEMGKRQEEADPYPRGTADRLLGRCVIVNVLVGDDNISWDENNSADARLLKKARSNIEIASTWIEEAASEYGSDIEFIIYDSDKEDLQYTITFGGDMIEAEDWEIVGGAIMKEIPTEDLLAKYEADSILYMFLYNTDSDNMKTSWTYLRQENDTVPYEYCSMYMTINGTNETPATFAHEILHCFGAPDLYVVDSDGTNYGITQEYIDYIRSEESQDIMFSITDKTGKKNENVIENTFSELDAYYTGIINRSGDAVEFKLGRSDYDR